MIFVNFKTYEEGSGENALSLAKLVEEVSKETQVKIIPVVQAVDLAQVVGTTTLEVWVQHSDPFSFGAHTGAIIPKALVQRGAMGTFLNHSEHRFQNIETLEAANRESLQAGLKTLIFAANLEEMSKLLSLKPTFIAYEPPELVGSKETSVSKAEPEVVAKAAVLTKEASLPLVVGAGIKSFEDVKKSVEYGAVGIAVASSVVLADDPRKKLLELSQGF